MSDNCDHNFGTFDDFGVNDQRVSHNMILMSKYKGQHGGKNGQKIRARPSPPFSGNTQKKTVLFIRGVPYASVGISPGSQFSRACPQVVTEVPVVCLHAHW